MKKTILAALAILIAGTGTSFAQEKLKVAIPQRGFWDSSWVEFGQAAGFFKEAGLEIEMFYTDGGAQTLTAAMSGSVDIALSNGILGVIGAYVKGAAGQDHLGADDRRQRAVLVGQGRQPEQDPEGRAGRQDHGVLVARLVDRT